MTDADLRQVEHDLQAEPASLALRRQHARLLQRAGDGARALEALDLAWRLGADELWDELQAALAPRRRTIGGTELAWIPRGPFVQGADDLDDDVRPARLVTLPGFFIAVTALRWGALEGAPDYPTWPATRRPDERYVAMFRASAFTSDRRRAVSAIEHLNRAAPPGDGTWALPSEAQWERAHRASYLRPDGRSPYGVVESPNQLEWTSDVYEAPVDPGSGPADRLYAVRGAPGLPPPHHALFRDAADGDGKFSVDVGHLESQYGIALRPVVVPTA